jgi:uncharacterized membrane protein YdjX (TVP38/TMEM64 family)
MKGGWVRPVLALLLVAAGIVAARSLGLGDLIRLENVARLKQWIEGYGALAPAVYVAGYILATVFFVPGLPITVLGGVAFGPLWGTLYVWIGAGSARAGLPRRALCGAQHGRRCQAPRTRRWTGSGEHGWRIVMLTRVRSSRSTSELCLRYHARRLLAVRHHLSICILPYTVAFTFAGARQRWARRSGRSATSRSRACCWC